jgi:hypothetical protein
MDVAILYIQFIFSISGSISDMYLPISSTLSHTILNHTAFHAHGPPF